MLLLYASGSLPSLGNFLLLVTFMGGLIHLIGSLKSAGNQKDRLGAVAGLLALVYVAMGLYWLRGGRLIHSGSIATAFRLGQQALGAAAIPVLVRMVSPNSTKVVLRISYIGFIVANIFALALVYYHPRPALSGIRLCYLAEVLFVGMLIPSAIFYWLDEHRKDERVGGDMAA